MIDWSSRKVKYIQRYKFFNGAGHRNHFLTLPAGECECIKAGIESGVICESTSICAVERETKTFLKMQQWLSNNRYKFRHCRMLNQELSTITEVSEKFDLVFLDLFGNLTVPDVRWINEYLQYHITDTAIVGLTVSQSVRANPFIPLCQKILIENHYQYFSEIRDLIRIKVSNKDDLNFMTTYYILLSDYCFDNCFGMDDIISYKEPKSRHPMVLFKFCMTENKIQKNLSVANTIMKAIFKSSMHAVDYSVFSVPSVSLFGDHIMMKASDVVDLMQASYLTPTAGRKAASTRAINNYIAQQEKMGHKPIRTLAGLNASLTRRVNRIVGSSGNLPKTQTGYLGRTSGYFK